MRLHEIKNSMTIAEGVLPFVRPYELCKKTAMDKCSVFLLSLYRLKQSLL